MIGLLMQGMSPLEKRAIHVEATRETSHNVWVRMHRVEGIMVPESKEANFYHTGYRIPCVRFGTICFKTALRAQMLEQRSLPLSEYVCQSYIETTILQ